MDLTIIIVNWNGGELFLRCLRSIRASQTSFQVRVVVVDNDSRDGSREMAQSEFPDFHIFNSGANLGFARANNLARPFVATPLVLFLNPDTELRADTLQRSVECLLDHPDVGALGCKMCYLDGSVQQQGLQWHLTPLRTLVEMLVVSRQSQAMLRNWLPMLDPTKSSYVCKLYGGYLLARREALDAAGWFDERYFMYAEDGDLSRTMSGLGWKLYYTGDAEILHVAGGTSVKAPSGFSTLMKLESIGKMMLKYYGPRGAFLHRAAVLVAAGLRWFALLPLCIVGKQLAGRKIDVRASLYRQSLMIGWALGRRKARVAALPVQHDCAPPSHSRGS